MDSKEKPRFRGSWSRRRPRRALDVSILTQSWAPTFKVYLESSVDSNNAIRFSETGYLLMKS